MPAGKTTPKPDPRLPSRASIAETKKREAARKAANADFPEVELLSDAFDKQIDHRVDVGNDDDADPLSAPDPANAAVDKVRRPGMAYKLLSPRCIDVLGMRGYTACRDEQGNEVKVGSMILGEIPQRVASARQATALKQSNDEVGMIADDYAASVDRLKSAAAGLGMRVLHPGEEMSAEASTDFETLGERRGAGVEIRRGA